MVLLVVGVGAVYTALNVYSLDVRFIEGFVKFAPVRTEPPRWLFVLAAVATAVMPVTILAWALKSRRTVLLDTGIVLAALSLVTLRQYVHVARLWVVLTASGASLIVLALAVERALRRSPDGERGGFTADALFSDERRQQMVQTVPVVAAFTPAAHIARDRRAGLRRPRRRVRRRRRFRQVLRSVDHARRGPGALTSAAPTATSTMPTSAVGASRSPNARYPSTAVVAGTR